MGRKAGGDPLRNQEVVRDPFRSQEAAGGQGPLPAQHKLGKTLLNNLCEQAALSGQSPVKVIPAA